MGNTDSSIPGDGYSGYHVLKVEENSPGSKAGLQAYFDYIVAINGMALEHDSDGIVEILRSNQDKEVALTVYSSKTKDCRDVKLFLDSNWGGNGLLGASIRYCPFEGANENVWHVLEVIPRSPADLAGLKSNTDYIIGADSVLNGRDDFFDLVENHDGSPLKLYVYSSVTDKCREVHLTPNSRWGGNGLLGCDIGFGYLHRIPVASPPAETEQNAEKMPPAQPQQQVPVHPPPPYDGHGHSHNGHACDGNHSHQPPVEPAREVSEQTQSLIAAPPSFLTTETHTTPSSVAGSQPIPYQITPPKQPEQQPIMPNVPAFEATPTMAAQYQMPHANLAPPGMPPINVSMPMAYPPTYYPAPGMYPGYEMPQQQFVMPPQPFHHPGHQQEFYANQQHMFQQAGYYAPQQQQGPPLPPLQTTSPGPMSQA